MLTHQVLLIEYVIAAAFSFKSSDPSIHGQFSKGKLKGALKKVNERIIKQYLDIVILGISRNSSITGYEIIAYIEKKYDTLLSPGTVYGMLYSLERQGLLQGSHIGDKRYYSLTEKGKNKICFFIEMKKNILNLTRNLIP
jgi:Predicted transcriptional regulators